MLQSKYNSLQIVLIHLNFQLLEVYRDPQLQVGEN